MRETLFSVLMADPEHVEALELMLLHFGGIPQGRPTGARIVEDNQNHISSTFSCVECRASLGR